MVEILIGVGLLGTFAMLLSQIVKVQAQQKKIAEVKAVMSQLLVHSQAASKRFELYYLDSYLATQAGLEDCFKSKGTNCELFNTGQPIFPNSDSQAATLNAMLRGEYALNGEPCTGTNCPIQVSAEWEILCQSNSCSGVKFLNQVEISPTASNSSLLQILSAVPPLKAESLYSARKEVGLVRTLASNCNSATGINFDKGTVECSPLNGSNTNKLFDLAMGYDFQNSNARLVAGDSSSSVSSCPAGTTASMEGENIVCNDEPSIICSQEGWIVKNAKCCNPTIPNNGDGWGPWSTCSATCEGGTQSRSCQYSVTNYCDSACSDGQNETQACNTHPCPIDGKWGPLKIDKKKSDHFIYEYKLCNNPLPNISGVPCSVESSFRLVPNTNPLREERKTKDCIDGYTLKAGVCFKPTKKVIKFFVYKGKPSSWAVVKQAVVTFPINQEVWIASRSSYADCQSTGPGWKPYSVLLYKSCFSDDTYNAGYKKGKKPSAKWVQVKDVEGATTTMTDYELVNNINMRITATVVRFE
ncbi:MAG: hypothetical protein R3A80_02090 [Bdellovibrionota bacterium]